MKKILQIILILFISQTSFAQKDTVLLSVKSKLIPEYQIVYMKGDIGIRENYTFFKHRFWLHKTDTITLSELIKTEKGFVENKKRKPLSYEKIGICDSTINNIRNSASYWRMKQKVDEIAKSEIGYDNNKFILFRNSQSNNLNDFSSDCFSNYLIKENLLKERLLNEISSISDSKKTRFKNYKNNPKSINLSNVSVFLNTFNQCELDLKSLEIIIINKPTELLREIEKLNNIDFYSFKIKLNDFSENSDTAKMKESLQNTEYRSKRKRKMIQKIKKRKANKSYN